MSQEELADRARVTVKAVGALERGERRRPDPHTVRALADALGLDEDERSRLAAGVPDRAAPRAGALQETAAGPVPGPRSLCPRCPCSAGTATSGW